MLGQAPPVLLLRLKSASTWFQDETARARASLDLCSFANMTTASLSIGNIRKMCCWMASDGVGALVANKDHVGNDSMADDRPRDEGASRCINQCLYTRHLRVSASQTRLKRLNHIPQAIKNKQIFQKAIIEWPPLISEEQYKQQYIFCHSAICRSPQKPSIHHVEP